MVFPSGFDCDLRLWLARTLFFWWLHKGRLTFVKAKLSPQSRALFTQAARRAQRGRTHSSQESENRWRKISSACFTNRNQHHGWGGEIHANRATFRSIFFPEHEYFSIISGASCPVCNIYESWCIYSRCVWVNVSFTLKREENKSSISTLIRSNWDKDLMSHLLQPAERRRHQ